mmetsp:Transcript_69415/g.192057  ORF Transcript_69415/g.192057 Transcript_69415/m.192057 type:complete len:364 (-) Transcript_69415:187-1278(-)
MSRISSFVCLLDRFHEMACAPALISATAPYSGICSRNPGYQQAHHPQTCIEFGSRGAAGFVHQPRQMCSYFGKRCAAGFLAAGATLRIFTVQFVRYAPVRHLRRATGGGDLPQVQVAPLFEEMLAGGGSITLLQIGACDGDFVASGGATSDDPVQHLLVEPRIQAILIEPNPEVFKMLDRNVRRCFGQSERIQLMNVAISPDISGKLPFYVVARRLAQEHPRKAPHWAKYQISSLDRDHVLKHAEHVGFSHEEFENYVDEIIIPSLCPAELFARAVVEPSAVDVLVVDAEGLDGEILISFLNVTAFAPAVIIFEATHMDGPEFRHIMVILRCRGYETGRVHYEEHYGAAVNVIAWKVRTNRGA